MKFILKITSSFLLTFGYTTSAWADVVPPAIGNGVAAVGSSVSNSGMATALMKQCKENPLFCAMAAMSVAQAASALLTAKSSQSVAKSATTPIDYASTDSGNGVTGADLDSQIAFAEGQLAAVKATIKKDATNVDLDKGTVKTSKGTTSLASLNSGKAMVDAGLADPSQIAQIDAMLKKQDAFKIPAMTNGAGSGGGGSMKSANFIVPEYTMPQMPSDKPAAPVAAGLVKLANGEPIGTASDNIFNMLHNRYQVKVKEKIFVGQEGTASTN